MSALAANPAYTALLAATPPRIIRTDEQNEAYLEAVYKLEQQDSLTAEEAELAELLTLLIENFEESHYALPPASPSEVLRFLMQQHATSVSELDALATDGSSLQAFLDGTASLTTGQIKQLSERFKVSPAVFFEAP